MTTPFLILLFIALVVTAYVVLAVTAYVRMRGTRIVICPETQRPAAVTVDAGHAALSAVREHAAVRLASCSRWPERRGCAQPCAKQIEIAPRETRVFEIMRRWYANKTCAICRCEIPPLQPVGPKPGLLNLASPAHESLSWEEVPAERLPAMFDTHLPICSHCQVAESFRRQFPDLVVDRPGNHEHVH